MIFARFFRKSKSLTIDSSSEASKETVICQICHSSASYLDTVDFNKSCEDHRNRILPVSGINIDYYLCNRCSFCFAPEIHSWEPEEFAQFIYNKEYEIVDPDYKSARPSANAEAVERLFGASKHQLRHLDYGGGSGLLSQKLLEKGWDSTSYDPFVDTEQSVSELGTFDLVTAFEVFEHVPNMGTLLNELYALCKPNGLILFTTLISDNQIIQGKPLQWWYASPRNGHISLHSKESLRILLANKEWKLGSLSDNVHLACRELPSWALHLLK